MTRVGDDRSRDLAKIHLAASQVGLIRKGDDESYRVMLWSVAQVRSAKDLDAAGRQRVLEHLGTLGFVDRGRRKPGAVGRYQRGSQAALIRFLWTSLAKAGLVEENSERALRRYIAQHGGLEGAAVGERDARHLTKDEASKIIEQLKRWLHREIKPGAQP